MNLRETIEKRRMVRSFSSEPLDPKQLENLLRTSLRAPSAGNTRGVAWLTLLGAQTAMYWEHATTKDWRSNATRFPGLARAPVIALCLCSPKLYLRRYGEPDKLRSGLGTGEEAWPVPYWFGDAAFVTMQLLLGVAEAGLGASFLGNFRNEARLLRSL
ncbi:MAG: nitroreductase family protein, partial [Acidimicrobiales bacterium]